MIPHLMFLRLQRDGLGVPLRVKLNCGGRNLVPFPSTSEAVMFTILTVRQSLSWSRDPPAPLGLRAVCHTCCNDTGMLLQEVYVFSSSFFFSILLPDVLGRKTNSSPTFLPTLPPFHPIATLGYLPRGRS